MFSCSLVITLRFEFEHLVSGSVDSRFFHESFLAYDQRELLERL